MIEAHQIQELLPQSKFEWVSDVGSVVAIASPWWLPFLKETSEVAALLLPIFGVVWLVVQISVKLHQVYRRRGH